MSATSSSDVRMALAVGTSLGPYELVSAIGAGSMGDVNKERGTRLDWRVRALTHCGGKWNRYSRTKGPQKGFLV